MSSLWHSAIRSWDAIVAQVLDEGYEGVTGTRRIPAGDDLAPQSGWLFTYQFIIPGPQSTERLVPAFIRDNGEVDVGTGHRIVQRACRFDRNEQDIRPTEIPDNLRQIEPQASRFANTERESLQQQAETQAAERFNREIGSTSGVVRLSGTRRQRPSGGYQRYPESTPRER